MEYFLLSEIAAAGAVTAISLAHLYTVFRRVGDKENTATRNRAEGNANTQAGGSIRTYLPLDVDAVLQSYQRDKERLYKRIDAKEAYIAELEKKLRVSGFPLLHIGPRRNLTEIHSRKEPAA